jgi:hypothetical protein
MASNTELVRRYLDALILLEDEYIAFAMETNARFPLRGKIMEGANSRVLLEGPMLDKIVSTAKSIKNKYDDVTYGLLATATTKAMSALETAKNSGKIPNENATALDKIFQRISKVGKLAAKNPRAVLMLVSMTTMLVGMMHTNPASAATAADGMDAALKDMEHLKATFADFKKSMDGVMDATTTGLLHPSSAGNDVAQHVGSIDTVSGHAAGVTTSDAGTSNTGNTTSSNPGMAQATSGALQHPSVDLLTKYDASAVQKIGGVKQALESGQIEQQDLDLYTKELKVQQNIFNHLDSDQVTKINKIINQYPMPKLKSLKPDSLRDYMTGTHQYFNFVSAIVRSLKAGEDDDAINNLVRIWTKDM